LAQKKVAISMISLVCRASTIVTSINY
jgi:hypothetical protein